MPEITVTGGRRMNNTKTNARMLSFYQPRALFNQQVQQLGYNEARRRLVMRYLAFVVTEAKAGYIGMDKEVINIFAISGDLFTARYQEKVMNYLMKSRA